MKDEDVEYIAKRYHKGKFSIDEGWQRLDIAPSYRLRRIRIAAAVAIGLVLSATAAVFYRHSVMPQQSAEVTQQVEATPKEAIRVIDFENAELTTVAAEIRAVYGVEVVNLPENADEYRLSLHFEGNPVELVTTINEILGTNLTVK